MEGEAAGGDRPHLLSHDRAVTTAIGLIKAEGVRVEVRACTSIPQPYLAICQTITVCVRVGGRGAELVP